MSSAGAVPRPRLHFIHRTTGVRHRSAGTQRLLDTAEEVSIYEAGGVLLALCPGLLADSAAADSHRRLNFGARSSYMSQAMHTDCHPAQKPGTSSPACPISALGLGIKNWASACSLQTTGTNLVRPV